MWVSLWINYADGLSSRLVFRNPPADLPTWGDVLHARDGDEAVDAVQGDLLRLPGRHHPPHPGALPLQIKAVRR
jgi:hypothetical protein